MSITDALSRISQIEQQVSSLETGMAPAGGTVSTAEANGTTSSSAADSTSAGGASSTGFSSALSQAQASQTSATATGGTSISASTPLSTGVTGTMGPTLTPAISSATDPSIAGTAATPLTAADPGSTGVAGDADSDASAFPTLAGSALASTADPTAATATVPSIAAAPTEAPAGGATGGAGLYATSDPTPSTGVALPANAGALLTTGQQQFASTLSAETGLSPAVVSSWLLAEESGGAAQSRQAAGNNDWLNIGYTGSGTFGAADAIWSDPVSAANATAGWLKGEDTIPGYGTASSGIQAILGTVGQTPQAQIEALQSSGWSGSGYPSLPELYGSLTGTPAA